MNNPYPQQQNNMQHSKPYPPQTNPQNQNPYQQNIQMSQPNTYGQNPYGQNPYGQNPNGQNPYGQNPYGQNSYGQNPYGQNPNGQNPNYSNFNQPNQPYGQSMSFNPNMLARQLIMNYADTLFNKYDGNGSGYLDVREIYPAISELYQINNMTPPPYNQVLQIMKSFDKDGNGLLDRNEFRTLLLILNGHQ